MAEYAEKVNDGRSLEIFAASYYQSMDFFVESNLKWIEERDDETGNADVLELDVIAKIFNSDKINSILIECKRGCTYNDLFKFSGVANLVGCDRNILLCQSHEIDVLKKIGEKIVIDVIVPEELAVNINNDAIKLKFEMLMTANSLCNRLIDKDSIKKILCNGKKLSHNEIMAYNRIRAYMSILIGKVWRESNSITRINWIMNLLKDNKGFVREISRIQELKPGNKSSEFYMSNNALCQAAGYLVLKIKISYIVSAVECAINIRSITLNDINDDASRNVVRRLSDKMDIAIKIPKFLQYYIYIFGGIYSELGKDLKNIANYIDEPITDIKSIIQILKELFTLPAYGIQWGFISDMDVCSLKYVPSPLKALGIENRSKLGFDTDDFCFTEQWIDSLKLWEE